jgi:ATP-dependent protease HslVU (ClpYQ) peptidase subunit
MTCIVGIAEGGKVYIGGDSAGVGGGLSLMVSARPKVFRNGDFVIGYTDSFRLGQLLAHSLTPPKRHPDTGIDKFMMTTFIDAVRDCLKTGGYAKKDNEVEKGGTFLVGYCGRIFLVENNYQVLEYEDGFAACGCGDQIALGAMYANPAARPLDRLRIALEAAERYCAGVRGPFHFEQIG